MFYKKSDKLMLATGNLLLVQCTSEGGTTEVANLPPISTYILIIYKC